MESAKPQKSRIRDHLVSSRDELSKCLNTKKTERREYYRWLLFYSCPYGRLVLIQLKSISYS